MATKAPSKAATPAKPVSRYSINRKRRLERTIKAQPNNEQAKVALSDDRPSSRKTPNSSYWSHTMIREARLFKEFTGRMDLNVFSSTESVRGNARLHLTRQDWSQIKLPEGKVSFTLGARAHDALGKLVWA